MGVRKLRSVFMRFIIFLVLGASFIVLLNIALYLHGVKTGFIYPLNRMSTEIEQAKEYLQAVDQITEDSIPPLSDYVLFTEEGQYIRGSLQLKDTASLWNKTVERKQTSSDSYLYTVINRSSEILVLRYPTVAQFHNPVLRHVFPSADLFLIILVLFELLILLLGVAYLFGKYFTKKMDTLLVVVQKVENQDLDFEIKKTKLFEIDQILDALEHMRNALKRSLTEQWQADKARQEQISALAHDLKTPLTIIRGNAELLYDTPLSEEQLECTEYIRSSSIQVQNYMQTLIEVTRSWDRYPLHFSPTNLEQFLDELRNQAKGLCMVQHVSLEWECNTKSALIRIDHQLLMRALLNVVANAVEHTPKGGTVTCRVHEKENNLFVVITDTGNGFSDKALKSATEPFFMDDSSRNSKSHFGIGLFVAHSTCQKHGGDLILENCPEEGAKVTLVIPLFNRKELKAQ